MKGHHLDARTCGPIPASTRPLVAILQRVLADVVSENVLARKVAPWYMYRNK